MKNTSSYLSNCMFAVRVLALLALGFAALASPQAAHAIGPVCRVASGAPGPTHNGSTWAFAFTKLQTALGNAGCTEVWVKAGVFKPASAGNRSGSFIIKPGVAVYGGFDRTESARYRRNPATHVTILSGDIDNNDTSTHGDYRDIVGSNSYIVVHMTGEATSTTVLDGFTIKAGDATGVYYPNNGGGGLRCEGGECRLTLVNLTFSGNRAEVGGAIYIHAPGSPTLSNVTFHGNRATMWGGAMLHYGTDSTSPIGSPTLTNVTFQGNSAGERGGAMYNDGYFYGNSSPKLTNVTFSGNSAAISGGAIFNNAGSSGASYPILKNVILWGNTASYGPEIYNNTPSALPNISYSIIHGGCTVTGSACGAGNLNANPKLGALANNGGSTKTMALLAGSSAIDTGSNTGCPAKDQRGVSRPQGLACDIGAYEVKAPTFTSMPTSWNFGIIKVGTTSAGKVFTVKNIGGANLVIGAVSLTGGNPSQFHIIANKCSGATLLPNATCSITITFKPTSPGTKGAYINIPDNAAGHPHKIHLSGSGGT